MTYVFIFTGEFGYELLNWNGVVRKWVNANKTTNDTVVICSRHGLESIYEMADYYIDISDIDAYKNSIADCYCSYVRDENNKIIRNGKHQDDILYTIHATLTEAGFDNIEYVYSPIRRSIDGCIFGTGGIYGPEREPIGRLDVNNNIYRKFEPVLSRQNDIETKLGISLDQPFILCQHGARSIVQRDKTILDVDEFIHTLALKYPVICLGFDSSKMLNSKSKFNETSSHNIHYYNTTSIEEQSCLISKSLERIFFSEGDFRSHIYVPPFYGKSVIAIATYDVFHNVSAYMQPGISNAPIEFWNANVWPFGPGIRRLYYEDLDNDKDNKYQNIIKLLELG